MSHVLHIALSDETYQAIATFAAGRGQSIEELLHSLVDDAWEQECARYDAAFANDPDWQESARKASEAAQAGQQSEDYFTTEEFFRRLGASDEQLEEVRQKEQQSHANS
ncbi:MAG TPA: hypothetical protein VFU32_06500 [Ktedonobacterales bacterium]|nr:hypothetical protein [Ktedonobacterales bacterium]